MFVTGFDENAEIYDLTRVRSRRSGLRLEAEGGGSCCFTCRPWRRASADAGNRRIQIPGRVIIDELPREAVRQGGCTCILTVDWAHRADAWQQTTLCAPDRIRGKGINPMRKYNNEDEHSITKAIPRWLINLLRFLLCFLVKRALLWVLDILLPIPIPTDLPDPSKWLPPDDDGG